MTREEKIRAAKVKFAQEKYAASQSATAPISDPVQSQPPADTTWRNDGQTGLVEQSTAGFNTGLARGLGLPVDALTGGINGALGLANQYFGTDIPAIQDPVGGSASIERLMAPTIAEDDPQSVGQRYARSVAQELGASAPMLMAGGAISPTTMAAALGPTAVSATGSGVGAQVARDVLPGSAAAEVIGGLVGGMAPIGVTYALRAGPAKPPSVEDLKDEAGFLYRAGETRPAASPTSVDSLRGSVEAELRSMDRITPTGRVQATGDIKAFLDVVGDYKGQQMSPKAMQNARTYLQDAAASVEPGERRVAMALMDKFDGWRAGQVPEFGQADAIYSRAKKAELVEALVEKGTRRAASSGTGGNEVNAIRQNLRGMLDSPSKSRGFSAAERAAVEQIVRGDKVTNTARLIGRASPTSGALPMITGIVGSTVNTPASLALMLGGAGAKSLAEARTVSQVTTLGEMLRAGGPVAQKALTEAERLAIQAALARALTGDR